MSSRVCLRSDKTQDFDSCHARTHCAAILSPWLSTLRRSSAVFLRDLSGSSQVSCVICQLLFVVVISALQLLLRWRDSSRYRYRVVVLSSSSRRYQARATFERSGLDRTGSRARVAMSRINLNLVSNCSSDFGGQEMGHGSSLHVAGSKQFHSMYD